MGNFGLVQRRNDGQRIAFRARKSPVAKRAPPNGWIAGDGAEAVGIHVVIVGLGIHSQLYRIAQSSRFRSSLAKCFAQLGFVPLGEYDGASW
jgi:hypothetical protein